MKIRKYYERRTGEVREEIVLSKQEQASEYHRCIAELLNPDTTRKVLDEIEKKPEFKVHWKNYGRPSLRKGGSRN